MMDCNEDATLIDGCSRQRLSGTSGQTNSMFIEYLRPCAAELTATILFVFIGTMSIQVGVQLEAGIAHGCTIALLVMGFGAISGAHMNPAVTLGVLTAGSIHWLLAIFYVLVQLLGGILGAAFTRGVLSFKSATSDSNHTLYELISGGTHTLCPGMHPGQAILCEILLTFVLVTTVLLSAVDNNSILAALAIGFAVLVDISAAGNLTGASMNPARSFGPALVYSDISTEPWRYHYVYWIGPLLGSLSAAVMYRLVLASGEKRLVQSSYVAFSRLSASDDT